VAEDLLKERLEHSDQYLPYNLAYIEAESIRKALAGDKS
jgi:hypothetical protein